MADWRIRAGGNRITDPRVMRALAHPARIEILEHLNDTGAAVTATECADLVGLSPSATSYHLRELAKYGLVEQAPSRGDGRERVWRSTGSSMHIDADPDQGPEAVAATQTLIDLYLSRDLARVREWVFRNPEERPEWRDAAALMNLRLLVTADELNDLNSRIRDLLEPFRVRDRQASAPDGARKVTVSYQAFPE